MESVPPLRWLFFDMNSFFASVEQHDNPTLRGKPVGVIPIDTDATSFIAASREAKQLGVRMGIPVWQARRQFPELHIIKARPTRYVEVHRALLAACDRHAPVDKIYSIDEWSVRLAPQDQSPDRARRLASRIKQQIAEDLSAAVSCSAGIAPTRLLAKIACDLHKPDGLTQLNVDDLPAKLSQLALDDLPGISGNMLGRLQRFGVQDVSQMWQLTCAQARQI